MTEEERKRNENMIARDGERVRVSIFAMDAQQRAVAAARPLMDAASHRPHSRSLSDSEKAKRAATYSAYEKQLTEAWRAPRGA